MNLTSQHKVPIHYLPVHILQQIHEYSVETICEQQQIRKEVKRFYQQQQRNDAAILATELPDPLSRAMECASEKGASSWLSALPKKEDGFSLHKSAFRDAISLRHSFHLPTECTCGKQFTVQHVYMVAFHLFVTTR